MKKRFFGFLRGAGSILSIWPPRRKLTSRTDENGFNKDKNALREDFKRISNDFRFK